MLAGAAGISLAPVMSRLAEAAAVTTPGVPDGAANEAILEALPGKRPLIKLTYRPPNFETPLEIFRDVITPNDAFFVRYHLSDIPQVDATKWALNIGGGSPLRLSLADLKSGFEQVEVVAVCQCSGNRRGLSQPHVAGVEWGYGAMGNARWKGVRLKDVLAKAGLPADAVEIVVNGADAGATEKTPDFVKSIPVWKANDPNTIIAFEMNGQPLPHWNGFPARLIVPGWTATYWMKHLTDITPSSKAFDGFWMKGAYRIPLGLFPSVDRFITQETPANTPITEIMVNSLITAPAAGTKIKRAQGVKISGIAWDGGRGIDRVAVSTDEGKTWSDARLGEDLGRFSFRSWSFDVRTPSRGAMTIMARATNKAGQTQVSAPIFNPPGYHHNVVHAVRVEIA
jgi:DMSO/TMAO reductase YedYZ molybdopterin-dependent catalytic subunit